MGMFKRLTEKPWLDEQPGVVELRTALGIELDARSNYKANKGAYRTSHPKVFAAGDCRSGQSLVGRAINVAKPPAQWIGH